MKKRVKRKFNPLKFLSFIAFIIICYFLTVYLLDIKTKNIVVLNNNYYSDEKIIETSGIENYPKFLSLNTNKIKKKLLKLDLIENVTIKKKWNFVLELTIKEKKILYLVRSENKYRLSDNKLYDLDDVLSVPTLINYIPESNEKKFVNAFKNIDNNIISMISEIEYSKTSYDSDRFLLYMNDGNMVYVTTTKLKSLNKYVDIVSKLENKKGILYLDSGNYFEIKEK
ncbi:cell division protein DivIB [Clostridium sp. CAG:1000]|jgi:cell division septal protein FtsQ|nr:FtsQ-type POTRA domain-containing protein [Clostridium sp.]CCX35871.1 cell division protein DivIB [Clostridium sp. CAG:1000]